SRHHAAPRSIRRVYSRPARCGNRHARTRAHDRLLANRRARRARSRHARPAAGLSREPRREVDHVAKRDRHHRGVTRSCGAVGKGALAVNLFWLLIALGACPDAVTWAHGREATADTWQAAGVRRRKWVAGRLSGSGYGYGGSGSGDGYGYGGYGFGAGDGGGDGSGDGDGYGYGSGDGDGYGYGFGDRDGSGDGDGYYGYGYGRSGDGAGDGYGYGSGYGAGDGDGYDSETHNDIISVEFYDGSKLTDGDGISTSAELIVGQLRKDLFA